MNLDAVYFDSADNSKSNWQKIDNLNSNSNSKLVKCLKKTLNNIQTKFNNWNLQPAVIWSGNGYHIYLPVEGFVLEHVNIFSAYIRRQ